MWIVRSVVDHCRNRPTGKSGGLICGVNFNMKKKLLYILALFAFISGCKEDYDAPLKDSDKTVMVMEGVLNVSGPTRITLSQSMKIDEQAQFKPVLQAQLVVEGKDNSNNSLTSAGAGVYTHPNLNLTIGGEYRLRIKANGKEYLSEWVIAKQTPPIDSINWKKNPEGLSFYVSTHDPSNNSRYYKWDYDETWQINAYYFAMYKWTGGTTIVPMDPSETPYSCWKYDKSNTIMAASSAQLNNDVISEFPAYHIPLGSEKLSVRYSVLMKQSSVSKTAYEYLSLMKKNTETLGSIFDPQPSELRGNISNIADPGEIVIGYVIASTITEKRIFVTSIEANWSYLQNCEYITVPNHKDSLAKYVPTYLPWSAIESAPGVVTDYFLAFPFCVDCTKRGGSLSKPSYW